MNHRIRHSDEEWMQLITSCRQSGLLDKEWCTANGENIYPYLACKVLGWKQYHIRHICPKYRLFKRRLSWKNKFYGLYILKDLNV